MIRNIYEGIIKNEGFTARMISIWKVLLKNNL